MPKLLIIEKFIFILFGVDVNEKRKHIHVEVRKGRRRKVAKFWLEPEITLVEKGNLSAHEINEAKKLIQENHKILFDQIEKFMEGKKTKTVRK